MNLETETATREARDMMTSGDPGSLVLALVIRLDIRFTPGDQELYSRYLGLLPAELKNSFFIVFTRTEDLQRDVKDEIKLSSLKELAARARQRFVSNALPREQILSTILSFLDDFQRELADSRVENLEPAENEVNELPSRVRKLARVTLGVLLGVSLVYYYRHAIKNHIGEILMLTPSQLPVKPFVPEAPALPSPPPPSPSPPLPQESDKPSQLYRFMLNLLHSLWNEFDFA